MVKIDKKVKAPMVVIAICWMLMSVGTLLTKQFDLNGIYDNWVLFTIIKVITGISIIFISIGAIYFIIFGLYHLYKSNKLKNGIVKILLFFTASIIGLIVIAATTLSAVISAKANFGRSQIDIIESMAFIGFHLEAIEMHRNKGYADFSQAASFEWDTLYIFSNDFNQDELDKYVTGKTYRQIRAGFKRTNDSKYPQEGSIVCFVKDGNVLICDGSGMEIFESEEMENLIYYRKFTMGDAIFQCELIRSSGPNIWTLLDDLDN